MALATAHRMAYHKAVNIDHMRAENGPKREEIWIIRPSASEACLPHRVESIGFARWEKRVAYARGEGHGYLGFEFVEAGAVGVRTAGGEALARAGDAYFLLPGRAHRYWALEPTVKRFASLGGPAAMDLLRHFGYRFGAGPALVPAADSGAVLAWFDAARASLAAGTADAAGLAAGWYALLCRLASSRPAAASAGLHPADRHPAGFHPGVERALACIDRDPGARLDRQELSRAAGLSATHLSRLFVRDFGLPVAAYVRERRLEWAERLLRTTRLPVTEIALKTGFDDPLYFSAAFKRRYGAGPRAYRVAGDT
jgi:AraC-like DNA-binding protein